MKRFDHHNAQSMREAVRLLKSYEGKAKVNAGGTDLLAALKDRVTPEYPDAVINIKTIAGLDFIKKDKKGLRIGALTRIAEIAKSPVVKDEYKLLAEAAHSVATPHVRNMATIGGNLAQDVRCWFYRYPHHIGGPMVCLRKGGKFCSALNGDNRYHSIFGAAPLTERPCSSHCPARTDIPSYLSRVRRGDLAEAARILMDYNPMPAVTGRVCPVFCEPECNRGALDEPVAVKCIEREVGDYVLSRTNEFFAPPIAESGKRVAVVGSGPAGLAAAFYLRKAGHSITVYEKLPEPGGMLHYSIPPYRLPKELVSKQIQALKGMGIAFECGVNMGTDISMDELSSRFDAVFLAVGTWKDLKLDVPGENVDGILYALPFLKQVNSGEKVSVGKKVIVVGGGNVAIDAARSLLRLGSDDVTVVYRRSRAEMPAYHDEVAAAIEEGVKIRFLAAPTEVISSNGKVTGLKCIETELGPPDQSGRRRPVPITGSEFLLDADTIIPAIGQTVEESLSATGLMYGKAGTAEVDSSSRNIFAGGDMISGPSTVIQAIASAREAAGRIDESLGCNLTVAENRAQPDFVDSRLVNMPRVTVRHVPAAERIASLDIEETPGFSMNEIQMEAQRCLNCGCLAVSPSDIAIGLIALDARIVTTKRNLPAELFFRATATSYNVLEADELIKEIRIPTPPAGSRQVYEKFTLRKPIDFAVVSVAAVLTTDNGFCKDARIVLGAVAPEPIRVRTAEQVLKGQTINENTAAEAAKHALVGASPLGMNAYKVEIAKTLVKRAILG